MMTKHASGTREQWLAVRLELLKAEKDLTRRSDELVRRRQELPWVEVSKEYRLETDAGTMTLADLFAGRSQLLVYHFMFGPDYKAGCPSCSSIADGFNGIAVHLENHDVTLAAVSRAPTGVGTSSRMGPVSRPASICMSVTPVCASPASMARWIGAAPRQRGSSEA